MKKVLIIILLSLFALSSFSQNISREDLVQEIKPLIDRVEALESANRRLNSEISRLRNSLSETFSKIDSLQKNTQANRDDINKTARELGLKITTSEETTNQKISEVDDSLSKSLSKTALWAIIGILAAIVVSGVVYWLLRKKQQSDKTDLIEQLSKTKSAIMEESAKLDKELVDLLEKQLKALNISQADNPTIDHTLPLKIADEITRINTYANTLDPITQDYRALTSSVKRLMNTFKVAQYEIVDLLGQKYDDGLKVIVVNAMPDENLKEGEEIITRIIKPLVKYKGEQIQAAQVDISVGQ